MKRLTKIYLFTKNRRLSGLSSRYMMPSHDESEGLYVENIDTLISRYTD